MNKLLVLLLTGGLMLSLLSCNRFDTTDDPFSNTPNVTTESTETDSPPEITKAPPRNDDFHDYESAQALVEAMGIGWNLGNTLDPVDVTWGEHELDYETAWGNPRTTEALIDYIKEAGFETIRIPVTWTNHVGEGPAYPISEVWLERVREIVDWCMDRDFFVILNMHHDENWISCADTDYEGVMTKYRAIWTQIAERFKGYSEKLIFESMNEIGFDDLTTKKGCALLNEINAEFTRLIRSTGGNNEKRYLLLAGYLTDIDQSIRGGITLPDDDRTILSLHYYSPPTFAIADAESTWGYQRTWGTEEDFKYMRKQFVKVKTNFVDNGIPVIIGEFGTIHKDKDMEDVVLYTSSIIEYALTYHMCPVWWDNGSEIDRTEFTFQVEGMEEAVSAAKARGLAARLAGE